MYLAKSGLQPGCASLQKGCELRVQLAAPWWWVRVITSRSVEAIVYPEIIAKLLLSTGCVPGTVYSAAGR